MSRGPHSTRPWSTPAAASGPPCSGAVGAAAADWTADQQALAAAVLDVLWSMETYERLAVDWQLDTARAVAGATWVIGLVGHAVAEGRGPG